MLPALPLIDISAFLKESSLKEKQEQAAKMHLACKNVGFFYLIGHGLNGDRVQQLARRFFQLPLEEKEEISIQKNDLARGYQRLGQNITKYAKDWHEAIDIYASVDQNHYVVKNNIKCLSGKTIWPKNPIKFEDEFTTYINEMKRLGLATMRCIAMGLGLDEFYFDRYMNDTFWVMRVIGYPPLSQSNESNVGISCGEHTDYGCLTILNTDDTRDALQVMTKDGHWLNANPIPEAFVVNIGDMLNIWTNDLYQSTLHRVIHKGSGYRVSIPFFYEPSFDTLVEPIDKLVQETGGTAKHKPVVYGQHLLSKVNSNFV